MNEPEDERHSGTHTHVVNTVVKFAVVVMECAAQALYPP